MIKVNDYFAGKVKSLGAESRGGRFTAGVIEPGEYVFPASSEEHIMVTYGECQIKVDGKGWQTIKQGEKVVARTNTEIVFKVEDTMSYICIYK